MILIGLDDTDIVGSKGTNQLAKAIVRELAGDWRCVRIVRHQLLDDPRVPYTSRNGSASIALEPQNGLAVPELTATCRRVMREWYIEGSDPGLCVAVEVTPDVKSFGHRCQREVVTQSDAAAIADSAGVSLEGLGGTNGGIIGALAAVGLAATLHDGRIVQLADWPEDLSGPQPLPAILERGVEVRDATSNAVIPRGTVDVGKKLRPNLRGGRAVLFVRPSPDGLPNHFTAMKLP